MTTAANPFVEDSQTLGDAVREQMDMLEEQRALRVLIEAQAAVLDQQGRDLVELRSAVATAQGDVLRGVNAATFAAGKTVLIDKKVSDLVADFRSFMLRSTNGHG